MFGASLRKLQQPLLSAADSDHKEHFAAMMLMGFVGGLLHLFFLIFFSINAAFPLVWINLGCCCLYVAAEILVLKSKLSLASVLMSAEVCVYAMLSVWLLGWSSGAQWLTLVALLPHYMFSDVSTRQRALITVLVGVTVNLCLAVDLLTVPILSVKSFPLLQFVHLNIVLLCVMMELAINDIQLLLSSSRIQQRLLKIREDSISDPLTGLHNRRYMDECFAAWLRQVHRQAVFVILDLDDFSEINNTYTHFVGDQALRFFADSLRTQFRQTDLRVRWGGDEFLLVLPGIGEQQAWLLVEKLSAHLAQNPYGQTEDGAPLYLAFSAGVSRYDDALGVTGSMHRCDQSMYEHKRGKKERAAPPLAADGAEETTEGA